MGTRETIKLGQAGVVLLFRITKVQPLYAA